MGRAFWRQSLANAEEARILLSDGRIAAALVSCQHAIEKSLKAALFVEIGEHNFQLRHNMSVELGKSVRLQLPLRDMNSLRALQKSTDAWRIRWAYGKIFCLLAEQREKRGVIQNIHGLRLYSPLVFIILMQCFVRICKRNVFSRYMIEFNSACVTLFRN
ncbi:MAG: HEPN domain-containing protein [Candidatus Poribacteria bacterium]